LPIVIHKGVALLSVLVLSGCATHFGDATSNPGTTFGKIYVDTPEVYSRERLVNDRFQQDAWLRKKLDVETRQGYQGSAGTLSQTNTNFRLGLALPSGQKPRTSETSQAVETSETSLAPPTPPESPTLPEAQLGKDAALKEVDDTPIEQFRDAMAYREEVRNEILENQLDDRHDIAGNTLYRLKLDATVVPLHDTSAYAMVEVTLTGSPYWNVGGDDSRWQELTNGQESRRAWMARTGIALPDWEFANYVPGLDKATVEFYSRAYETWVRDIDLTQHSADELLYGKLNSYFEFGQKFSNNRWVGVELKHCDYYQKAVKRNQAREELIARGIPKEYLKAGTYEKVSIFNEDEEDEYEEIETFETLCILSGLANFISDLRGNGEIYTYAVTPKERVQRIYGDTLAAGTVGGSVAAEKAGLGASLGHSNSREARANAIMRQPQVVGYSPKSYHSEEATRSGKATMGWLIGPRYKISSDPNGVVSFRHVPSQHALTGIISVPSWWTDLELTTKTYWLDENGVEFTVEGKALISGAETETGSKATIALPGDLTGILDVFEPKRRQPNVVSTSTKVLHHLRACHEGSVIIRGSQLWRSTVVTLGAQQADLISVLPNMKGIIATFNTVNHSISGKESLYLWTSEGEKHVREILISGDCETSPSS
jgi:hypothetical protein